MLLTLTMPRINELAPSAVVDAIHADVGAALSPGAKLLDVRIDLSAIAPHDCPPASLYRLALRDRVYLRSLAIANGDEVEVGAVMATFTTEPDEPIDGESARAVRVSVAGILAPPDDWDGT